MLVVSTGISRISGEQHGPQGVSSDDPPDPSVHQLEQLTY